MSDVTAMSQSLQPAPFVVESVLFQKFLFFVFSFFLSLFFSKGSSVYWDRMAILLFYVFLFSLTSCILAGNVHPWVLRMCRLLFEGSEIPLFFSFLFFSHTMYD